MDLVDGFQTRGSRVLRFYAVRSLEYSTYTMINGDVGYTIDPAYASFTENELGSLEIGKRADFVVLSQDVMKVCIGIQCFREIRP